MAYTPYYTGGWQSGEEGGTPITPDALNHMDDGIAAANSYGDPSTMSSVAIGNSIYISAVSGGYIKFGRMVVFSIGYTMKAAITGSAANAVAGLPVPVGPARYLEFDKDGTTAIGSTTFANLTTTGTINLRGAHAQGDTYYISGAYISAS